MLNDGHQLHEAASRKLGLSVSAALRYETPLDVQNALASPT